MDKFLKRAWAEIHLDRLEYNLGELKKITDTDTTDIACVVKANAYGHSDSAIVPHLEKLGIRFFAVSNIYEAQVLRSYGVTGDILILGYTPPEYADELSEGNIIQSIVSVEHAKELSNSATKPVRVHIKLDTGMGRIGLNAFHKDKCIEEMKEIIAQKNIVCEGMFTHFAVADSFAPDDVKYTKAQIDLFFEIKDRLSQQGINLKEYHCLNSAGGTYYRDYTKKRSTLVRFGIMLYGLTPDVSLTLPVTLKPVMDLKASVSYIKNVEKGRYVSYGRTFMADKDMTVATIPIGYADGYPRSLSSKGEVLINGKRAKIIGRVCMDQMMVDISGIDNVKAGTEVTLIGTDGNETITADDIAQICSTIGYEIVCNISKRIPRVIYNNGKIENIVQY